jgi:hypothetical protein
MVSEFNSAQTHVLACDKLTPHLVGHLPYTYMHTHTRTDSGEREVSPVSSVRCMGRHTPSTCTRMRVQVYVARARSHAPLLCVVGGWGWWPRPAAAARGCLAQAPSAPFPATLAISAHAATHAHSLTVGKGHAQRGVCRVRPPPCVPLRRGLCASERTRLPRCRWGRKR